MEVVRTVGYPLLDEALVAEGRRDLEGREEVEVGGSWQGGKADGGRNRGKESLSGVQDGEGKGGEGGRVPATLLGLLAHRRDK